MPLSYNQFKDYLTTFLWKSNDTTLVASMDSLIAMANAELSSKLNIQRRQQTALIAPESQDYVLPDDFRSMVSLTNAVPSGRDYIMKSVTLSDLYQQRARSSGALSLIYAVDTAQAVPILRLVGPFSAGSPGSMVLVYRSAIPDYQVTDASWVADLYLDLYTYTVLSHAAPFLREDERVPIWVQMKGAALEAALMEDAHHINHGGSPLQMSPHRQVPNNRGW